MSDTTAGAARTGPTEAAVEQFRAMLELSASAMTVSATDGRLLAVNQPFADLVGRSVAELETLRYQDITHPDDNVPAAATTLASLNRGDRGTTIDKRYLRPDGRVVHVRVSGTIVWGDSGRPVCYVSQVTDLTELRAAQQAARHSDQQARQAIASSADAYVSVGGDGLIRDWNPAAVRMFGWSQEEAMGADLAELLLPAEARAELRTQLECGARTGKCTVLGRSPELTGIRRNGDRMPIEANVWASGEPGVDAVFHAFVRDVSDRVAARVAARRYELVFDSIGDGVTIFGLTGTIEAVNPAAERLLGRTRADLVGSFPIELIAADPRVDRAAIIAMINQDGFWADDVDLVLPDGSHRLSAVVARPLTADDGNPSGYLAVHRDVTEARQATVALIEAEARWRLTLDRAPIGISLTAVDGQWLLVNDAMCRIVGYPREQLMGMTFQDITHPDDLERDLASIARLLTGEVSGYQLEKRYVRADGELVWVSLTASLLRNLAGEPMHLIAQIEDVTERRADAETLAQSEARYRLLAENSSDIIGFTDLDGTVRYVSPAYETVFGQPPTDRVGSAVGGATHPDDRPTLLAAFQDAMDGTPRRFTYRARRADGSWVWLETHAHPQLDPDTGAVTGVQTATRDITERRTAESELERLALSDALTGLANRALLTDRLRLAQDRLRRTPGHLALLMLDLDRFKLVNDTLGHSVGDALLVEVANRLRASARPTDTVARLGGDEFVILLDGLNDVEHAAMIADRILVALREPMRLAGAEPLEIRGSIGIAVSSDADHPADSLYREADLALYRAKDHGRDRHAMFDASLRHRVFAQVRAERQLRTALSENLLVLHYQPIVSLVDGAIVGAEALVRMRIVGSDELVMPDEFIGAAEESGLVAELDLWVLRRAIDDLVRGVHGQNDTVAINVSPRSMADPRFVDRVSSTLAERQADPSRLHIEVTERTLMQTTGSALDSLQHLRRLGVRVGIDDFGTGYSALGYLQQLPLDFLKIDRSFVSRLGEDHRATATVQAVVVLAHAHNLTVTAEGVETQAQLDAVRELGCDHAQGYLIGRAVPV